MVWHQHGLSGDSIAQNADDWQEAIQDYQGLYLVYVDCHI